MPHVPNDRHLEISTIILCTIFAVVLCGVVAMIIGSVIRKRKKRLAGKDVIEAS